MAGPGHRLRHRDRAVRRRRHHAPAQEAGAGQRCRGADQGPGRAPGGRPGGAQRARHRPLPRARQHGPGREKPRRHARRARVPAPRIRGPCGAVRAGEPAAADQPLHRRLARRRAAAQARQRPVGEGQAPRRRAGARQRRRAAQHLCAPRRARGPRVPLLAAGLRAVRQRLRLRRNRRPERRDPRRHPGPDQPAPHGPAGLRRRGLWQDRGRAARGLRGRHGRQAGGAAGAHHAAGRAALPHARRPLQQVAREGRRGLALSLGQGDHGGPQGAVRRHGGHRGRHAQAAQRIDAFQEPGPAHHRRGAPLWRAPQGADEGAARRGGRAHAHGHADPAHAGHGARRPARPVRDRHGAAAAPGDQDLCAQRRHGRDPRGRAARIEARRPGLLPAQRGRDHREPAPEARGNPARGAHRRGPRPDARARTRKA